jgi:hypothetical protein
MNARFYYRPKLLQVGEFKGAFEQTVAAILGSDAQIRVRHPRHTGRAGVSDTIDLDTESLRAVVDLNKIEFTLIAGLPVNPNDIWIAFESTAPDGPLLMSAVGETSLQCLERFALNLGLEQTKPPKDGLTLAFEEIGSRLSALEKATRDIEKPLKCFISFKFDDAQTVTQLAAVHIERVTGEQFEPRRIEDKVKAKLRADIDFIIAVITKAGESKWIRDELADANARDLWVVVLLEDGATFDKGIFGTLEYIRYDLAIDQTFAALLEGVNFIKAEIAARNESQKS